MTRARWSHKGWLAGLLLLLPSAGGCLLPVCEPVVSETRGIGLGADPAEYADVHAFRLNITTVHQDGEAAREFYRLSELSPVYDPASPAGKPAYIPAQRLKAWTSGYSYWLPFFQGRHEEIPSVALRVYRPGYELIVVDADTDVAVMAWTPVNDFRGAVTALDRLFLFTGSASPMSTRQRSLAEQTDQKLQTGSAAPEHRQALLFGASEYDRLALIGQQWTSTNGQLLQQLREKAEKLRALANQ